MRSYVVFGLALAAAPAAHAGGYYFGDSGIVAASRGGAWVAGADSQFAQLYNPAGLVHVDRPTLNLGASAVYQGIKFDRLDLAGNQMETAKNSAPPFPVPQFGFAMPIGEDFAFAFGGYSGLAPDITFDIDGSQRYTLIDSSIWQYAIGASVAWQPVKAFSIGVGFGWNIFRAAERIKVSTSLISNTDGTDRPEDDVLVSLNTWDIFTPSYNIGILVDPAPWMTIGVSMNSPTRYAAKGSASMDFNGHSMEAFVDEVVVSDDNVLLNIDLPMVLRWGVAFRPWEHTEIEIAGAYESWGTLKDIVVEEIDATIVIAGLENEVPSEIALPAGFRDSYSFRLGGETTVIDNVALRTGVMWERSALTPQNVSAALVDTDKFYLAAGAGFDVLDDHMTIDIGMGWMFYEKLAIRDSTVSNINVINEELSYVVGNGDLAAHGWNLSAQVTYRFGDPSK